MRFLRYGFLSYPKDGSAEADCPRVGGEQCHPDCRHRALGKKNPKGPPKPPRCDPLRNPNPQLQPRRSQDLPTPRRSMDSDALGSSRNPDRHGLGYLVHSASVPLLLPFECQLSRSLASPLSAIARPAKSPQYRQLDDLPVVVPDRFCFLVGLQHPTAPTR